MCLAADQPDQSCMAKLSMAIGDVISLIKAVIGYIHCKKMRRMVFFMNTPTGASAPRTLLISLLGREISEFHHHTLRSKSWGSLSLRRNPADFCEFALLDI